MDEHKRLTERERGDRAKLLLEDEILIGAFTALGEQLMSQWLETGPSDVQRREDAWRSLKLLDKIKRSIEYHVETGKFAAIELEKADETAS